MAKKTSLLEQMRANPAGDWKIQDVETLCQQEGLRIRPPNGGSHYVISSVRIHGKLTLPYKRPIKKFYIKELVKYTVAHRSEERSI